MLIPDNHVPVVVKALECASDTPTMGESAKDALDYIEAHLRTNWSPEMKSERLDAARAAIEDGDVDRAIRELERLRHPLTNRAEAFEEAVYRYLTADGFVADTDYKIRMGVELKQFVAHLHREVDRILQVELADILPPAPPVFPEPTHEPILGPPSLPRAEAELEGRFNAARHEAELVPAGENIPDALGRELSVILRKAAKLLQDDPTNARAAEIHRWISDWLDLPELVPEVEYTFTATIVVDSNGMTPDEALAEYVANNNVVSAFELVNERES